MHLNPALHLASVFLLATCVFQCSPVAQATVIGAFGPPRVAQDSLVSGHLPADMRNLILSNFPGTSFATSPTLTPEFLSSIDLLMIATAKGNDTSIAPLTNSEQSALFEFVRAGGDALLMTEGLSTYVVAAQSIAASFGMTVVNDGLSGILPCLPTDSSHPLFDGPFGNQGYLAVYGSGVFSDLGPYATSVANMVENGQPVAAIIEAGAIEPGSGRVLLLADTHLFIGQDYGGFLHVHEPFLLNSFAYLTAPVPEPDALIIGLTALGALMLTTARRCNAMTYRSRG